MLLPKRKGRSGAGGFSHGENKDGLFEPVAKKQRDAPQPGCTDQGVDNAAEHGALPAEEPCNQVELKDADEEPVDGADDNQQQRKGIEHMKIASLMGVAYPEKGRNMHSHPKKGTKEKGQPGSLSDCPWKNTIYTVYD